MKTHFENHEWCEWLLDVIISESEVIEENGAIHIRLKKRIKNEMSMR